MQLFQFSPSLPLIIRAFVPSLTEPFTSHAVQGALQWLEDNQDKSLEAIVAAVEASKDDEDDDADTKAQISELETGEKPKSLICNDCGKRFRNHDLASYHATKTYVKCIALPFRFILLRQEGARRHGFWDHRVCLLLRG